MSDLTDFLLARIAEDEAAATRSKEDAAMGKTLGVPPSWLTGIADRMLAECEAKRRIVELHPEMLEWCQGCAHEAFPCRTLRALAAVYADHPHYRDEWRP